MFRSSFCRVCVGTVATLGLLFALVASAGAIDRPPQKTPTVTQPSEVQPAVEPGVATGKSEAAPSKGVALSEPTRTVMGGPVNDDCAAALLIEDGDTAFTTVGASDDGPDLEGECDLGEFGDDIIHTNVWYNYTATCNGDLRVTTCEELGGSATYDTRLAVYDGGGCPADAANVLACNDDDADNLCGSDPDYHSTLLAPGIVSGNVYKIEVGGFGTGDSGTGSVRIECIPCGNGVCETELGETCLSCPEDCADGSCDGGEDCGSCPADCGECPCDNEAPFDCDNAQIGIQGDFTQEFPNDDSCWDLDGDDECDFDLGPCVDVSDCPEGSTCTAGICSGEDIDEDGDCDVADCGWTGLAFPMVMDFAMVDTLTVQLNTNRAGGDVYLTGSTVDADGNCQPDIFDIRRSLGCAISGLAEDAQHDLHFDPLTTTPGEIIWAVFVVRSGKADVDALGFMNGGTHPGHQVARSAIDPSLPNRSYANLEGTGNAGDWSDLDGLLDADGNGLGTGYCVALKPQGQPADDFDCVANPDPVGACCGMEGGCGDCPTDVDDSGDTGPFDLAFLLGNWGPVVSASECLDADGDGAIGPFDLAFLLGNWGPCNPPFGGEGCEVMRGFECGAAGGVYLGVGTICDDCNPACTNDAGDCCINNGTVGCDTSDCCHFICDIDPWCCGQDEGAGDWDSSCAGMANDTDTGCGQIGEVCEPTQCVPDTTESIPECIQSGTDSSLDGFLGIVTDEYGAHASWADFGGGNDECHFGDMFNPAAFDAREATFGNALFWYKPDTEQRVVLSDVPNHDDTYPVDFSGYAEIPEGGANVASDQFPVGDVDGVNDTLNSAFNVCGPNDVSLAFTLEQTVERVSPTVSVWTQVYNITNISGTAISFQLARQDDYDMFWGGSGNADDSVGTLTNDGDIPGADRSVYQQEDGEPSSAITLSSPQAFTYWGGKGGVDPDGPGDNGPAYGCGTDMQQWDAYGVPEGWANHVANVGYDTDGESGVDIPDGCTGGCICDGSIGMTVELTLEPGASTCVCIQHTYGQQVPWMGGTCPVGCDE